MWVGINQTAKIRRRTDNNDEDNSEINDVDKTNRIPKYIVVLSI